MVENWNRDRIRDWNRDWFLRSSNARSEKFWLTSTSINRIERTRLKNRQSQSPVELQPMQISITIWSARLNAPDVVKYLFRGRSAAAAAFVGCRSVHEVAESVETNGGTAARDRLLLRSNTDRRQIVRSRHRTLVISSRIYSATCTWTICHFVLSLA